MKILDEMKKKIKDRSNLMKIQEVKNEQLRKKINNLYQTIEEKEIKYKQTLESGLLDEIAQIKEEIARISNQLEYQEGLLEEAKKQKVQVDFKHMLEEAKEQSREIDLEGAIEKIEEAKQAYLDALSQAIHKADRVNELFGEIKSQEVYLTLEAQKELKAAWEETLQVDLPKELSKQYEESDLSNKLYYMTRGKVISFKEIEKQKEQEQNEKRKKDIEEFEIQSVINNKKYGHGRYDHV